MSADIDGTTPYLRNRYAIVGVGETSYRRGSQETTRNLATWAIGNALDDAGLEAGRRRRHAVATRATTRPSPPSWPATSASGSTSTWTASAAGPRTEALIGIAIGVIEAGMCNTVAIFRSMNGYTQVRIGGTGARAAAPISGDAMHMRPYGWQSAGQMFAPTFMRHMYDYGTTRRAGGPREGGALQARLQQPQGLLPGAGHGGGRGGAAA